MVFRAFNERLKETRVNRDLKMSFQERLKKVRKDLGLTQVEFAKLGGVKSVTQTNYERGLRFPTVEYLFKLSEKGIDIHYIMFGYTDDLNRDLKISFQERLKKVRKDLGLTQVEFAKLGGVKISAQANYERGLRHPTLEYLLNLKKAEVDIYFIIFGEEQIQEGLTKAESKLLLAYRNSEIERRKAIEFVADISD